jgi:hypothetical protein
MATSERNPNGKRPSKKTFQRLIRECKIMESRVTAILNCDAAISQLVAEDVFGRRYSRILQADRRQLQHAIRIGERDLGEVVEIN